MCSEKPVQKVINNDFKILFIGDIVGRSGREIVSKFLQENKEKYDFIIANIENASHGFGLTKKNHDEIAQYGIDCMTSGNHIWDKKEVLNYIEESPYLIRPLNYHKSALGVGYKTFFDKFIVINLLGKTFMPPINCPFVALEDLILELKGKISDFEDKILIVDFHAEATAEKQCFMHFASELGVKCVFGTHTHTQTADEKILNEKTATITDAGFCGSENSIIGMEYLGSVKRLITSINERFEVETSKPYILNAVEVEFKNNLPVSIGRINYRFEEEEENKEGENV